MCVYICMRACACRRVHVGMLLEKVEERSDRKTMKTTTSFICHRNALRINKM